jgi:N-acetylglutamate synthase-like GNAT family acetyltransferase
VTSLLADARARGIHDIYLLTTTAEAWFPRFGFVRIARAAVPAALHASEEFRGACPDSAVVMHTALTD